MTDIQNPSVLVESELDREIDRLIRRIVSRQASPAERAKLASLSRQRIQMMQGGAIGRPEHRNSRLRAYG